MSTLNLVPKVIRSGNGEQKDFDFPFPATNKTDIRVVVYRAATDSELEIQYGQFDFVESPTANNGGTVKYPGGNSKDAVLSADDKICIMRSSRLGNDYVFSNQTRLLPESVEDADDNLSLQIMDLARDLAMSVKASVFDDRSPEQRWKDVSAELKKAQDLVNYINAELLEIPQKVIEEQQARIAQDAAILETVAKNKEDCNSKITSVSEKVETEKNERQAADEKAVKKEIVPSVVSGLFGSFSAASVSIEVENKDASTGAISRSAITLPVASDAQHGVMPKEAYATMTDLTTRVSTLEGGQAKTYALNLGFGPFSQENYQRAWENAAGVEPGSVPPDGTKLTNLDTNVDIQYFKTNGRWVERQTAVPVATESTTGIVKGSTENGKVAVETDGTMSLNGYDDMLDGIADAKSAAQSETTRATSAEESISNALETHKLNQEIHVTAEEKEGWNNKYSKLDSGIPAEDLSSSVQATLSDAVTQTKGGAMGAKLVARSTTEMGGEVRNISFTDVDPGVGSALANGSILMVFE